MYTRLDSNKVSVFEYETAKGRLYVEHAYPRDTVPTPRACIDVNLVLETVSSQLLQNGNWINIIGYVQGGPEIRGKSKKTRPGTWHAYSEPEVQGVLIWDASNIRVEDYQITLEEQRRVQSQIRHLHET